MNLLPSKHTFSFIAIKVWPDCENVRLTMGVLLPPAPSRVVLIEFAAEFTVPVSYILQLKKINNNHQSFHYVEVNES